MNLEIIEFIHENPDWGERLSKAPYCVKVKREGRFVLLKYEQLNSDLTISLVRECRGIILDESEDYRPVCVPFFKFGNFGESYIPVIDWATARIQEKLDGSLIKLWHYEDEWHVSSNGEIDARNAHVGSLLLSQAQGTNLYELFMEAWGKTGISFDNLDKDFNYMFELTSPSNRVIVRYAETAIHHIGTRDTRTLLECNMDIGVPKPREYSFGSLEECIDSAKQLGYDEEGYVVVDKNYNRLKVKSLLYVSLSHISQGVTTLGSVVEIIKKNEKDEFLTYFPEYNEIFEDIKTRIEAFAARQTASLMEIQAVNFDSRKVLAAVVVGTECPACIFALIDGKAESASDWLMSRPAHRILDLI